MQLPSFFLSKFAHVAINAVNEGVFVLSVNQDPALADGRLRPGDEILQVRKGRIGSLGRADSHLTVHHLQVNSQSLVGVRYKKCVQIIRSVANQGKFMVRRWKVEPKVKWKISVDESTIMQYELI